MSDLLYCLFHHTHKFYDRFHKSAICLKKSSKIGLTKKARDYTLEKNGQILNCIDFQPVACYSIF